MLWLGVREVTEAVLQVLRSGQRAALATVVGVAGSTPQRPGARLLLLEDGSLIGTVGGGAIEHDVVHAMRETLRTGSSQLLRRELGYDLGMCCGGRMEVFIEQVADTPRLVIVGAGHVAKPTAALALKVGFAVSVVDDRQELATQERFPGCVLEQSGPTSYLRRHPLGERDWLLIMTHDHHVDELALGLALRQPARYIGMIGSQRKVFRALQRLAANSGAPDLSRVFAPVGLDLGALGPDEIAVSIVAELIALRRGKPALHMRAVQDPRLVRSLTPGQPTERVDADSAVEPAASGSRVALEQLEQRVQRDLALLDYPRRDWVLPRTRGSAPAAHVYDVVIVGGGQGGLSCAFGLMRERIHNLLVVDDQPLDHAGPWLNFARMHTLRTPKYLTGPDLGIASLTPRSWYEAQHGAESWNALGLIPKDAWAAYLAWYRSTLGIPVQADTRAGALHWDATDNVFAVPCSGSGGEQTLYARRVVLATGIDGSGRWEVPAVVRDSLPRDRFAHTRDAIDFAALRGKRIAVLGAGASAFDNAATALDHGAAEVRLFFRRKQLVEVNAYRWAEFAGFLGHMAELPDTDKLRFIAQILRMGQLPPADTLKRARAHPGFQLEPGCTWQRLELDGAAIRIHTERRVHSADFVIVGTGFITDLCARPELRELEPFIARWSDRVGPDHTEANEDMLRHPYLGPHFEFTERQPGSAPHVSRVYNYTFGCLLSLGFGGASISGMKYSLPRLVSGIAGSFFVEDRERYYRSLCEFSERET